MIHKRKRNILVVTPVPTHPQNAGNRTRIYTMLRELQKIGYAVHVLYDGSEISSGHVKKKHCVRAMKKQWDSVFYIPNLFSAKLIGKKLGNENKYVGALLSVFIFIVSFFPSKTTTGERVDSMSGRIGGVLKIILPSFYKWVKRFFPDSVFIPGGIDSLGEIDSVYSGRTDYMLRILQKKARFQAVLVEYVFMSKALEHFDSSVRKIIDTHDVFSNRRNKYNAEGLKDFSFSTTAQEESRGLSRADVVIAIQDDEKKYFETLIDASVMTVGHIVSVIEKVSETKEKNLLFVGTANPGNIHAIKWFIQEVWPQIISKVPETKLFIAGKVSKYVVQCRGVVRLGEVKKLEEIYKKAKIVINPTNIGTGLKIKSIEALGFGKPVVASSHSAIGLEHMGGAVVVPTSKEEWVEILSRMLLDDDLVNRMSKRAVEHAKENNKRVHTMIRRVFGGYLPKYEFRIAKHKNVSPKHFIIFSWPRCGATTLTKVLEQHPDIKIKDEPFNHVVGEKISSADIDTLNTSIAKIRNEYDGMKHNWGLSFEQNMKLLSSGDPVVFLTRQNALQRVVSEMISKQTKSWNSSTQEHECVMNKKSLFLDIRETEKLLRKYIWETGQYKKFLDKQGIPYYDLTYEDLYGSNVSHRKKINFIKKLLEFVGKDSNKFETNNTIRDLLNPDISKANSEETYRTVSNIENVEEILGSDECGWLFED